MVQVQFRTIASNHNFNRYFRLYLKCILRNKNFTFVNNASQQHFKNENLLISNKSLYYTVLHLKFSSLFYSSQLTDIFSYEVPRGHYVEPQQDSSLNLDALRHDQSHSIGNRGLTSIIIYNFHILNTQERLYLFLTNSYTIPSRLNLFLRSGKVTSITELFFAANWLERELSELSGIIVKDKKDLRNLMLQYGDSSAPFQKSFPTIGLKEMFYNPIKDTIIQSPVSIQL